MRAVGRATEPNVEEYLAAQALGEALAQVKNLRAALNISPRRRPFIPAWEATRTALAGLEEAAELWIEALMAAEPIKAQLLADRAQRKLDEAPRNLQVVSQAWADLEIALDQGGSAQALGMLAQRAATRAIKQGSADLSATRIYRGITGRSTVPRDLGILLLFEDERASLVFDRERFWSLVSDTYGALSGNDHFARIVSSVNWRDSYYSAALQFADAGLFAEAVAYNAYHERQLVRSDLDLVKTLLEGPAKLVLRTRFAVKRRRHFESVTDKIDSLLQQAGQAGWNFALIGLNKRLRNAICHEEFDFDGHSLILDRGKPAEAAMGPEELGDEVLSTLESTLAMHTGVTLALMELDRDLAEYVQASSLSPKQAIWLGLALQDEPVEDVWVRHNKVEVSYRGEFNSQTITALAGAVYLLPSSVEYLTIRSAQDGELEGSLALVRAHESASDEWQRELCIWRVLALWKHNGRPVAHQRLWRCWATTKAVEDHNSDPKTAIKRLGDLREFAKELEDDSLHEFLGRMMRFHRHRMLDLPLVAEDREAMLKRARDWGTRPDDWPKLIPH